MAKQLTAQKYILKLNSTQLRESKWNLTITLAQARMQDQVISLGDSQMLRWIDELNGVTDTEARVRWIKREIKRIKREPNSVANRNAVKRLYAELDDYQFKKDYLHLVIDKDKDLLRACKGFKVNGAKFVRLLGTSGGVKNSTIVFVSERLAPELKRRIDNGRDVTKKMIPAKFEAYRALTCSGSSPVSWPRGILVVPDCETKFREDIISLDDSNSEEPVMEVRHDVEIKLAESDGYGLMLPSLAKRWSEELGLKYIVSGANTRCSWEKGMVFTFDFIDFAEKVAGSYMVKDAWGNMVDVRNVELVLTTSQLKLWDSYQSIDHYIQCCKENHYTFGIPKVCDAKLDDWATTNYQFVQCYQLTDEQIDELLEPTITEIKDVVLGDWRKALIFLRGKYLTEETAEDLDRPVEMALMANPEVFNDPFVKKHIHRMIEKRITRAKIGVIGVHGNYSILCGDPYALCQSMFGLEVTGLLGKGELYNRYWADNSDGTLAVFRAPMSTVENVLRMKVADTEEMRYWYQYMTTCTMFNAWGSETAALNGADKDGDLVFITDNKVLVENIPDHLTVFCAESKAEKVDVTEELLVKSNIAGFGDEIGKITNRVTSMYERRSHFPEGSAEYKELSYRITSGQLLQQHAIR